jgi:multicomponent Na+:H+ antiporter subunit C
MASEQLYILTGSLLFGLGFWGVYAVRDLVRKVVSLNIMGVGVFLVLVVLSHRPAPESPDPVPQAMVLTGLVVSVSATALALAMIRRYGNETGLSEFRSSSGTGSRHDG